MLKSNSFPIFPALFFWSFFFLFTNFSEAQEIIPKEWKVTGPIPANEPHPFLHDSLEAQLVTGKWTPPKKEEFFSPSDKLFWISATAQSDGTLAHAALRGGYAYTCITSKEEKILIGELSWHSMAYFNQEPRAGNVYGYSYVRLPLLLKPGENNLLLMAKRGKIKARFYPPKAPVFLNLGDPTFPDFVVTEPIQFWMATPVINATKEAKSSLAIRVSGPGLKTSETSLPSILALSFRKVGFQIQGPPPQEKGKIEATIELFELETGKILDSQAFTFKIKNPTQGIRVTFQSKIDNSIQYYAIKRATPQSASSEPPALILSTHGASVEAINQANAYSSKSWAHLVAPTNRRPFGFNWEEWGRLDALEVLALAKKQYSYDKQRVYLTGHSMGGHGTWSLGTLYPDKFAALGPSAGWITYWSYGGQENSLQEPTSSVQKIMQRLKFPSDALTLLPNTKDLGIYIVQGEKDNNVPPSQPKLIMKHLEKFHQNWRYHEEPGAGHWWGNNKEGHNDKGALCVDWPPMFDFFAQKALRRPTMVRQIDFITPNPGISSSYYWVTIEAQNQQHKWSEVHFHRWPNKRKIKGTTKNVARLSFDLLDWRAGEPFDIEIDGQAFEKISSPKVGQKIYLEQSEGKWQLGKPAPTFHKGPIRYGPFKEAFQHQLLFVYGTGGSAEENQWAFAKVRFDTEQFWYRANASVDILSDIEFINLKTIPQRTIVLYGNAQTNSAWPLLLANSPIQVEREKLSFGKVSFCGKDLGAIFIRPHPFSNKAYVVAISGTGLTGMKVTDRLGYFNPFWSYPDFFLASAKFLSEGEAGLKAIGYFGLDWSLENGEYESK